MNLKTLESFIVLAQELHFGRAAQQCGISQPAMSRLLSDLERDVGAKLLDRTSRDVSLTAAGQAFLTAARQATAQVDMGIRAARASVVGGINTLKVGTMLGAAQPSIGALIRRFKDAHPETRISLYYVDERSIGTALASGEIDVVVAWKVSIPAGIPHRPLGTVPMSVLVPKGHRLEQKQAVGFGDLRGEPVIIPARDRQPIIYNIYRQYTAEFGFEPTIAIEVATHYDLFAMVAGQVGVGNAPVVEGLCYPGISILPQHPTLDLHYNLAWLNQTSGVESLLALL
ncbi:MAG: LysR family transcriptional regulator [Cyanobacteria bacterium P01_A01_bin.135]